MPVDHFSPRKFMAGAATIAGEMESTVGLPLSAGEVSVVLRALR